MPTIVNLSSLHTLYPHSRSLGAFSNLCQEYSIGCCGHGLLQKLSNYAWVAYQYQTKYNTLIEPYKRGGISTEAFLANLLSIFHFLDNGHDFSDKADALKTCYSTDARYALLESAWNAIIGLEDNVADRFPLIVQNATAENPAFLISNSNALNVHELLRLFRERHPGIAFFNPDAIHSTVIRNEEQDNRAVEIAPNVFLCLSFRYQLFKTAGQNPNSTTSLLHNLITERLKDCKEPIEVVSQFQGDLIEAQRLGLSAENIHQAGDYFNDQANTLKKTM